MIEFLDTVDAAVFVFINSGLANPITDLIMPIVTNDWLLRALYGLAMLLLLWKGDRRQRWLVAASALVLLLSDQITAGLLKPMIGRLRPCHLIGDVHLLINCSEAFAMPSAHAANAFGQAALFGIVHRNIRWHLYLLATVIALSRIFVGVHYPGDLLVGAAIGMLIGALAARVFAGYEINRQRGSVRPNRRDRA